MRDLPPYIEQSYIARVCGWSRKRAARLLLSAEVTVVPPGRTRRTVSTQLLRSRLPEVYDALLAA